MAECGCACGSLYAINPHNPIFQENLDQTMEEKTVKLITLNAWGGRSLHPLLRFFRKKAGDTDIFCLQEMFDTDQSVVDERHPDEYLCGPLFRKISKELKDFTGFFASFEDNPHRQSLAIFIRNTVLIKKIADFVIYTPERPQEFGSAVLSARKLQYVVIEMSGKQYTIANYHGLWDGPKTDTPERIKQSEDIKKFLDSIPSPKILCGDFNLLPNTKSMRILEKNLRNLVKKMNVPSTRTQLYRHFENPDEPNFADYILVSPDIRVHQFEVLPDIVSDHSPLFLEFS